MTFAPDAFCQMIQDIPFEANCFLVCKIQASSRVLLKVNDSSDPILIFSSRSATTEYYCREQRYIVSACEMEASS